MLRFFLVLNFLTNTCLAASDLYSENEEIKNALNQNMYEPNYFSMILGLFLVVALIYLTGYLYQKLTKVKIDCSEEILNKVDLISTTPLGQGKNLHIIKVNGEYILIGATQNQISYLKEFKREDIEKFSKSDEKL